MKMEEDVKMTKMINEEGWKGTSEDGGGEG